MTHWDFFKKSKLFKFQETGSGLLGCSLVALCLIFCLFMLDFRILTGFRARFLFASSLESNSSSSSSSSSSLKLRGFLESDCDIFRGNWVWDETYPLYKPQDCRFLDEGFRCVENGRPDDFYSKWRWQPKGCDIPRFDAKSMLETLRNKRLVFVGDSIGRNQWESLLCLLSSALPNGTSSIYEVNGTPITKHIGSLLFRFGDFNCTVEYYRAPFLVLQGRPPSGSPPKVKMTLKLDQMDWSSTRWRDADLVVFNTGHWWNYEKTIRGGCYFQEGEEIKMEMSVETAFSKSIESLSKWVAQEVNLSRTHLIFRAYAPVHFRGGEWNTGGGCHLESFPDEAAAGGSGGEGYREYRIVVEGLWEHLEKGSVELLNVTGMTAVRKDGHSSLYYLGPEIGLAPVHRQDCSHWCLPGVPDSWNELLYAVVIKRWLSQGRI